MTSKKGRIAKALKRLPKADRKIIYFLLVEADSYEDEVNIVMEMIDIAYENGQQEMLRKMQERRE